MIDPNGAMLPQSDTMWIDLWKGQLATGLALMQMICGFIATLNISPPCIASGILQILTAFVVLAIEAPLFVRGIKFAQPISIFFDGKPLWIKCATYVSFTIFPCLLGCKSVFFILAFVCSLGISAMYGVLLGMKTAREDIRFQQTSGTTENSYSPTIP